VIFAVQAQLDSFVHVDLEVGGGCVVDDAVENDGAVILVDEVDGQTVLHELGVSEIGISMCEVG
jgi:hypothetical protein